MTTQYIEQVTFKQKTIKEVPKMTYKGVLNKIHYRWHDILIAQGLFFGQQRSFEPFHSPCSFPSLLTQVWVMQTQSSSTIMDE
jgi:hypothetical protein